MLLFYAVNLSRNASYMREVRFVIFPQNDAFLSTSLSNICVCKPLNFSKNPLRVVGKKTVTCDDAGVKQKQILEMRAILIADAC